MRFERFSKKQIMVFSWWMDNRYDAVIADGAIRSGKTLCMSISFILWAMHCYQNQTFAFCGKTIESLRRNVIIPLTECIYGLFRIKENRSQNYIEVSDGSNINRFYFFGGKDESSYALIQGITLAGIMFDEVSLMPRSFVEQAIGRCSVAGSKFWFNGNPENPSHWFYNEWILNPEQKNALYLHFTMDDNLSLSPEIRRRYESLYTGVFYDRYIKGLWIPAEGLIYPEQAQGVGIVPEESREFSAWYISVDYGTLNPCSMGLWGKYNGVWYRTKEFYYDGRKKQRQMTDEEYYIALEQLAGNRSIRAVIIDPSAASFIECIRRHGRFSVRKANNTVIDGIRLTASKFKDGAIKINDCCKDTIREFASYRWDEKATEDRPIKENDHAMDDIRYFVNTVIGTNSAKVLNKRSLGIY